MTVKLDENLPAHVAGHLRQLGHDADTVMDERLAGRDDATVWQAAQTAGRFFITQDLDFADRRRYAPGTHHGLLLVRLAHPGRTALATRIEELFRTEAVEEWARCVVVATDAKVRIQRPSDPPVAPPG